VQDAGGIKVYLAAERKNKDEIQGSFTAFRMTIWKGSSKGERGTAMLDALSSHSRFGFALA
jgi:hypothetical protein